MSRSFSLIVALVSSSLMGQLLGASQSAEFATYGISPNVLRGQFQAVNSPKQQLVFIRGGQAGHNRNRNALQDIQSLSTPGYPSRQQQQQLRQIDNQAGRYPRNSLLQAGQADANNPWLYQYPPFTQQRQQQQQQPAKQQQPNSEGFRDNGPGNSPRNQLSVTSKGVSGIRTRYRKSGIESTSGEASGDAESPLLKYEYSLKSPIIVTAYSDSRYVDRLNSSSLPKIRSKWYHTQNPLLYPTTAANNHLYEAHHLETDLPEPNQDARYELGTSPTQRYPDSPGSGEIQAHLIKQISLPQHASSVSDPRVSLVHTSAPKVKSLREPAFLYGSPRPYYPFEDEKKLLEQGGDQRLLGLKPAFDQVHYLEPVSIQSGAGQNEFKVAIPTKDLNSLTESLYRYQVQQEQNSLAQANPQQQPTTPTGSFPTMVSLDDVYILGGARAALKGGLPLNNPTVLADVPVQASLEWVQSARSPESRRPLQAVVSSSEPPPSLAKWNALYEAEVDNELASAKRPLKRQSAVYVRELSPRSQQLAREEAPYYSSSKLKTKPEFDDFGHWVPSRNPFDVLNLQDPRRFLRYRQRI